MNVRRSWFFFLVMLLLCLSVVMLLAEKPIMESWNTLRGSAEAGDWQVVGTGGGKVAAAATVRDGAATVRFFTTDGALLSDRRIPLPEELAGGVAARLLPVRDGVAYLGLYGPNAEQLYLYRIGENGESERLLALACRGDSFAERTARTGLSELLLEDGVLSFAVQMDGMLESYVCEEHGGLEARGSGTDGDRRVLSAVSAPDGALLLGGTGFLSLNGRDADAPMDGQSVTHLTQGRGGWYYIDAAGFDLCFADAVLGASYRVVHLSTAWRGAERSMRSVALTRDESVLMLLDGTTLTLTDAEGTRELTGILRPTALRTWLSLAKYAGAALLAAVVLWLLLFGLRRGYAPMALQCGSIILTCALLCFTVLRIIWLEPATRDSTLRENEAVVSGVLRTLRVERRWDDDALSNEIGLALEGAERGRNVRVVRALQVDGTWRTADGRAAASIGDFSPALADAAAERGSACAQDGPIFRYAFADAGRCLVVGMDTLRLPDAARLYDPLLVSFGVLALCALLILLSIGGNVRRISGRMEHISRGSVPERLEVRTGDELESMASIVNSLGVSMKRQDAEREDIEHSYRRFVPEKVLALLGKQSIREVDKSAFAARRMAVMTVWFSFPDSLYKDMSSSRLLFDSVNEVIERTASIVARKGGTVFHFAYNGFDVVMDDGGEAISTAVAMQQEVLSFNETRAQNGLPCVTLRIALDKGNVMLGIVGDTSQMEPTTISTSLSTVQELIDLCNRLKAGILCTEAIITERKEYGNRYMGKCMVGRQQVRVYEVFDGDEFNVRRGKAVSMREFSQGVYDLYGGSAAEAKHTFLQLAHNYPLDGGARYYLYLADRLEHDPALPCVLNMDSVDGEEM